MSKVIELLGVGMLASMFYQKTYSEEYQTVSKVKGFFKGWGYLILMMCGLIPILAVSEQGVLDIALTTIISLGITGAIFYRIISKRTRALSTEYPDEKLVGVKETYACIGMALYPIFAIMFFVVIIYLRVTSTGKRRYI